MTDKPDDANRIEPLPGRYGNFTVLPPTGPGNATVEEQTWPLAEPREGSRATFFDDPPECGNATAEELTWPLVTPREFTPPKPSPAGRSPAG